MFDIEYKGGNSVTLTSKKVSLVVDPRLSVFGLKDIKTDDEVELLTETRFGVPNSEARVIIECPGEYEVGDFTIRGISASRHIDSLEGEKLSTIYRIEYGDISVAILGNINPKLTEEQLELIGVIDIIVIPVGGSGYTLDATSAVEMVRTIEPKVVIPVHYADTGLKYEVPQDSVDTFIRELNVPVETTQKYKIKTSSSLPLVTTIIQVIRS